MLPPLPLHHMIQSIDGAYALVLLPPIQELSGCGIRVSLGMAVLVLLAQNFNVKELPSLP